jgi:hypothetical protein
MSNFIKKYSIGFKNEGFSEKCAEINEKFEGDLFSISSMSMMI